jgi:hypothetical protein
MSAWVQKLNPAASEALRLAARSQHIRRWQIPRSSYPMDRAGYHRWRTALYAFHADAVEGILRDAGYDGETIGTVRRLLSKKDLKTNRDMQTLEDAAALVFLEFHLAEFSRRPDMDEQKLVDILRKTWKKMSSRGHSAAKGIEFPPELSKLLKFALD